MIRRGKQPASSTVFMGSARPRHAGAPSAGPAPRPAPRSEGSALAAAVKALVESGDRDLARERFGELVLQQQRRAIRIAFQYLRDSHDADEAVQDAFVKAFTHIAGYREEYSF